MEFPTERELREVGILIAQDIITTAGLLARGELPFLGEQQQPSWKDPNNRTTQIDQYGRTITLKQLALNFQRRVKVYGEEEEATPGKHFHELNKVVAIVDPVDGTDLLVRGFSNWACAMIFFIPKQRKILCSVVGHASGDIYYATEAGAFVRPKRADGKKNQDQKLWRDPDKAVSLSDAAICYYGQKPKSFLSVSENLKFMSRMNDFKNRMSASRGGKKEELNVRLYNFGGNPMIVKVPSEAVDVVFSLNKTELHDLMPGAYIAVKAGAVLCDLAGRPIDIMEALLNPREGLRYILSGSSSLAKEVSCILTDEE
jgi:fructose-1,6-bisphosphatase/inositol monophosphatase family enzyme